MWDVKPGDKVSPRPPSEWVGIRLAPNPAKSVRLEIGKVYTVRETCVIWNGYEEVPAIRLVETPNPVGLYTIGPNDLTGYIEPAYMLGCFRKIVEQGGMETLRACLDPNKKIDGREIEKTLGLAKKLNKRFNKEKTK